VQRKVLTQPKQPSREMAKMSGFIMISGLSPEIIIIKKISDLSASAVKK
jgi:hypothetical protein